LEAKGKAPFLLNINHFLSDVVFGWGLNAFKVVPSSRRIIKPGNFARKPFRTVCLE